MAPGEMEQVVIMKDMLDKYAKVESILITTEDMWMALSSNKISISLEETKFLIFCICFRYPKCETVNSLLRRESGTDSENMPLSLEMQPIPLFSIPILAYAMAFLFESLIDPFKMIS